MLDGLDLCWKQQACGRIHNQLWVPRLLTKKNVHAFLGLVGYYHHFILKFAKIAVPLTNQTRKMPNPVLWSSECEEAFKSCRYSILTYLWCQHFTIRTDHQPLAWLHRMKNSNTRLVQWSLAVQPYNFTVSHCPGSANGNADCLSHGPTEFGLLVMEGGDRVTPIPSS